MSDNEIIELFFARDERALAECRDRCGAYMRSAARRILGPGGDFEEAENRAYLGAWETIPPRRPESLVSYLVRLCRRRAIDMLRTQTRQKRGGGVYAETLDELEGVLSVPSAEEEFDKLLLRDSLERFLAGLPDKTRRIFMQRYWWLRTVAEIADDLSMSESAVKMQLMRARQGLKEHLKKDGFEV